MLHTHDILQRNILAIPSPANREWLELAANILWKRSVNNYDSDQRGGLRIGWVALNSPPLWFHLIPAAATIGQLARTEARQEFALPDEFRDFLAVFNGPLLFRAQSGSAHLGFSGLVEEQDRHDASLVNAVDIELDNLASRLPHLPSGSWKIGRYAWDGTFVCMNDSGYVYLRRRASDNVLRKWISFRSFLLEELARLDEYFDGNCLAKDVSVSSLPIF